MFWRQMGKMCLANICYIDNILHVSYYFLEFFFNVPEKTRQSNANTIKVTRGKYNLVH